LDGLVTALGVMGSGVPRDPVRVAAGPAVAGIARLAVRGGRRADLDGGRGS
jgi:hypothetical protein